MVAGEERSTIDLVQVWPRSRWVFVFFVWDDNGGFHVGCFSMGLLWDHRSAP